MATRQFTKQPETEVVYLTLAQAAKRIQMSDRWITGQMKDPKHRKKCRAFQAGGHWRFPVKSFDQWFESLSQ